MLKYAKSAIFFLLHLLILTTRLISQTEWTEVANQPVLEYGKSGQWDDHAVCHPTVIKDGDTLRMWYSGADEYVLDAKMAIGYAWSLDGITWHKFAGNPVLEADLSWESGNVATGAVIQDGDTLKMWYNAGGTMYNKVGYATSLDGRNWNKYPTSVFDLGPYNGWDAGYNNPGSVIKEDGIYKMWFWATGLFYILEANFQIGYAISTDGIHWIKYDNPATTTALYAESDPVLTPGSSSQWDSRRVWHMSVMPVENGYTMWYTGYNDHHIYDKIGYAVSTDGIGWQKWDMNPVIASNPVWGNGHTSDAVLYFDGRYHMWYTGFQFTHGMGDYRAKIGYTVSLPNVGIEPSAVIASLPEQYGLFQNFPNPFNAATRIQFSLPEACRVRINIHDLRGRYIRTIVDADYHTGIYEIKLNMDRLSSGIYLYRIKTKNYRSTKKMIYIK